MNEPAETALQNVFADWIRSIMEATQSTVTAAHYAHPLPLDIARAKRDDFAAAGFAFSSDAPHYGSYFPHFFHLKVEFSPEWTHHAVTLSHLAWNGGVLWIDGAPVDVPCDARGYPLIDYVGRWIDDDVFVLALGGLEHPLADPSKNTQLGEVVGLFLWDAVRQAKLLVIPDANQAWKSPVAVRHGNQISVYPDACARDRHDAPARLIVW
jgi:hypothetical protein